MFIINFTLIHHGFNSLFACSVHVSSKSCVLYKFIIVNSSFHLSLADKVVSDSILFSSSRRSKIFWYLNIKYFQHCSLFSHLVVWETLNPKLFLYWSIIFLRRVDFPAPEGPHNTSGAGPSMIVSKEICIHGWGELGGFKMQMKYTGLSEPFT